MSEIICEQFCNMCEKLIDEGEITEQDLHWEDAHVKLFLCDTCNRKGPSAHSSFVEEKLDE